MGNAPDRWDINFVSIDPPLEGITTEVIEKREIKKTGMNRNFSLSCLLVIQSTKIHLNTRCKRGTGQ